MVIFSNWGIYRSKSVFVEETRRAPIKRLVEEMGPCTQDKSGLDMSGGRMEESMIFEPQQRIFGSDTTYQAHAANFISDRGIFGYIWV